MLLINIILATILQFMLFCLRLVFAVTYVLLGKNFIEKTCLSKKIYIFMYDYPHCIIDRIMNAVKRNSSFWHRVLTCVHRTKMSAHTTRGIWHKAMIYLVLSLSKCCVQ